MPTARHGASALCVKQAPDAVLFVGGTAGQYVELLCGDASQAGQSWRWRKLSPMHERRFHLLLVHLVSDNEENQRILVAGGCNQTVELLTIACKTTSDRGQWT